MRLRANKCHSESVLGHRLGVTATVGCHGHTFRELAQRNEVHATDHELDQSRAVQQLCLARPQYFGSVKRQEHAGVTQCLGACHFIELGEIYDGTCASESVGNDCLAFRAQREGYDEWWSA
jgi:hypothetical protein